MMPTAARVVAAAAIAAGAASCSDPVRCERSQEHAPAESITIAVQRFATGNTVVHVTGDLNVDAAVTLHPIVVQELGRSPAQLALNLREVARVDVGAVDALVKAASRAAASDISFCLVAAETGPVAGALAAAEVRQFFEIFASIQDAWDSPPR